MGRSVLLVALVACGGGQGGGSGECGPDLPTDVMTATDSDRTIALVYDDFVATADDLCPDAAAPEGLTIRATHVESGRPFEICVPRPDLAATDNRVGGGELEVVSAEAELAGCTFAPTTGTGAFGGFEVGGFCDEGTHPAGFRMSASLQISMRRDCAGTVTGHMLVFAGTVEVSRSE